MGYNGTLGCGWVGWVLACRVGGLGPSWGIAGGWGSWGYSAGHNNILSLTIQPLNEYMMCRDFTLNLNKRQVTSEGRRLNLKDIPRQQTIPQRASACAFHLGCPKTHVSVFLTRLSYTYKQKHITTTQHMPRVNAQSV